ncbi:hypothetical protein Tco_1383518 [Tanacetum coccineum]
MIAGGPNGWWSMMATTRPSTPPPPQQPFYGSSAQPHFFPHQYAPPLIIPSSSQAPWNNNQEFPDSLSQLLMSGLVSEDDKSALSHMQQVKKLENWEQQLLLCVLIIILNTAFHVVVVAYWLHKNPFRVKLGVQQGERNCLFPEDPGQNSHEEPKKALRSRGLCLVPVPCTMQVGSDNGADYWAPTINGGFR